MGRKHLTGTWPLHQWKHTGWGGGCYRARRRHLVLLHHILELQKSSIRLLCIRSIHQRLQVGWGARVCDVRHCVIDIHHTCLRHGSKHTTQRRIHSFPVGLGGHSIWSTDAANGLVVCSCCGAQELGVCLSSQHDHLVDGRQSFQRLELPRSLQIEPVVPVHLPH